jgi:hypothetical protein
MSRTASRTTHGMCYLQQARRKGRRAHREDSTARQIPLWEASPFSVWASGQTGRLDAGGLHAAELVLEFLDLVADPGRHLELKLRRGGVHLVGELLDDRDEVAAGRGADADPARVRDRGLVP